MEPAHLRPPHFDGAAAALYAAMSQVSEAAHNVRWAPDTEFGVWLLLTVPCVRWGRARASHSDVAPALALIRALASQSGQWLVWPTGDRFPTVMTLDNWRTYRSATPAGRRPA